MTTLVFAIVACSSGDPAPEDTGGQAGTSNDTVAGTSATAGSSASGGTTAAPNAGTGPNPSGGSGGTASGGASNGGASSGGANGGHAAATSNGGSGGSSVGGGSSGSGGSGSSGAGAGAGGGGNKPDAKPSMGCSQPASGALQEWVASTVMTSGASRAYSVRLPAKYSPTRAYPVIVLLHGCGGGTNNVPMENVTGNDAILVRGTGSASGTCWDTNANGKDVAFFDAMVADVKSRFCADESRVFVVGYSSGSWLVNQLTCIRADVVRGGATVSGGEAASGKCGGPVARIFLHDTNDNDNVIAGSEKARTRMLTQNKCDAAAATKPVDPSPCTEYQGCDDGYAVRWCQTSGKAHARQDTLAPGAFWNFFKAL